MTKRKKVSKKVTKIRVDVESSGSGQGGIGQIHGGMTGDVDSDHEPLKDAPGPETDEERAARLPQSGGRPGICKCGGRWTHAEGCHNG